MPRGFVKIGVGGGGGRRALSLHLRSKLHLVEEGKRRENAIGSKWWKEEKMGQQAEVREGKEEKGANSIFISARQVATTTTMWW